MNKVIFLKLGGSLITEKDEPATPRVDVITRIAEEIAEARVADPEMTLLLGHGSGSFGHVPASKYGTRQGVRTPEQWIGFAEVWRDAAALNRIMMDALFATGLPAIAFPPSSSAVARDGEIARWEIGPIEAALQGNLLPVIYGDTLIDEIRGGMILSTEELFRFLAKGLKPQRILIAGMEPGIYSDFPDKHDLIQSITTKTYASVTSKLQGSADIDTTGGMSSKVQLMINIIEELRACKVSIFSGHEPGNILRALAGERLGTQVIYS
ncbi:MAG: isopentenyl phosphate kinase [Anaerolineales bacterium]